MNPWVRIFFLPIMLLAGVVVGFSCALIVAPFALFHRFRQARTTQADFARFHDRSQKRHSQIYGDDHSQGLPLDS